MNGYDWKMLRCTKNTRGTRGFEAWTSVLNTLAWTVSAAELLEAIVKLAHRTATPQTA